MTKVFNTGPNRLSTPVGRWASIGPYYAMFPIAFAFEVVEKYCPPGGAVLDPFAGRASSVYAAVSTGRYGCGIEINEVGWVYAKAKLNPASESAVLLRNRVLGSLAQSLSSSAVKELPEFFRACFHDRVLRYLLIARSALNWKRDQTDATLMAIILVYLHGAKEKSLSNQMRQGKAMAPDYSVRWWRDRQSEAPDLDPVTFMEKRIRWRYAKGRPVLSPGVARLGDSVTELREIVAEIDAGHSPRFDLLFSSPPYYNVTSYHYDQWLRLWMLGHEPLPSKSGGQWQDGFWSKPGYRELLDAVFGACAQVMNKHSTIYIRTDAREFTRQTTSEVLESHFPRHRLKVIEIPILKESQTALYGDKTKKPGEVDIVLRR